MLHKCENIKYHAHSLFDLHCNFYTFKKRGLKNSAFLNKFKLKLEIVEQYGGELGISAI